MVKDLKQFSEKEQFEMIVQGVSYAMYVANSDREKYAMFKRCCTANLSKTDKKDVNILYILEHLGYSLDELGTYLYKDVISNVCEFLKDMAENPDMDKCKWMLAQLSDGHSNFYHVLAGEDKEMGMNSFHLYIQQAIDNINEDAIDDELVSRIFGDDVEVQDYGMQAFQIAAYTSALYSYDNVEIHQRPAVRKLTNVAENMQLKGNI